MLEALIELAVAHVSVHVSVAADIDAMKVPIAATPGSRIWKPTTVIAIPHTRMKADIAAITLIDLPLR